jgi:hypothetical protein
LWRELLSPWRVRDAPDQSTPPKHHHQSSAVAAPPTDLQGITTLNSQAGTDLLPFFPSLRSVTSLREKGS